MPIGVGTPRRITRASASARRGRDEDKREVDFSCVPRPVLAVGTGRPSVLRLRGAMASLVSALSSTRCRSIRIGTGRSSSFRRLSRKSTKIKTKARHLRRASFLYPNRRHFVGAVPGGMARDENVYKATRLRISDSLDSPPRDSVAVVIAFHIICASGNREPALLKK